MSSFLPLSKLVAAPSPPRFLSSPSFAAVVKVVVFFLTTTSEDFLSDPREPTLRFHEAGCFPFCVEEEEDEEEEDEEEEEVDVDEEENELDAGFDLGTAKSDVEEEDALTEDVCPKSVDDIDGVVFFFFLFALLSSSSTSCSPSEEEDDESWSLLMRGVSSH